jgi:hypothetical protein
MRSPRCWMCLVRWMHIRPIERLHGKWGEIVEAIVILDRRMMMWVVSTIPVPSSMLVLERFLVMVVLVVHLQLAHVDVRQT